MRPDQNHLDKEMRALRYAESPAERAAAAKALGIIGSRLATANLVAALFDSAAEVRSAAAEALDQIGDPAVAITPMKALVGSEAETPEETEPFAETGETITREKTAFFESANRQIGSAHYEPNFDAEVAGSPRLVSEEAEARDAAADLERHLKEAAVAKTNAETEIRLCAEREARLQARVAALAGEEKELRERADEVAHRRSEEEEQLVVVQAARSQAEQQTSRLIEEAERLRLDAEQLRSVAEEFAREIVRAEAERKNAVFSARRADAQRILQQTEALHNSELELLRSEEEELRHAVAEIALRRAEVETARQDAEQQILQLQEERSEIASAETARREDFAQARRAAEARERREREELSRSEEALRNAVEQVELRRTQIEFALQEAQESANRLGEVQARIQAAEDARRQDEAEYLRLEAEASQQAQEASRRLEAFRLRAQEEQQRLEENALRRAEEEERQLAELEHFRKKLESDIRRRAATEQAIQNEIKQLLEAETAQRKQIEKAEVRLHAAAEKHRLAEEEARLKVEQEEREYELRRKTAEEARLKAEELARRRLTEEQHLEHEAEESLRMLKAETRREAEKRVQRMSQLEAVRQRVVTEAGLSAAREEHFRKEIEELQKEEEKLRLRVQSETRLRSRAEARLQQERERHQAQAQARRTAEEDIQSLPEGVMQTSADENRDLIRVHGAATGLPTATLASLNSVDSRRRAAAVSNLARSGAKELFTLITDFFDDPSANVRDAAARALDELDPQRSVEAFSRAIEGASPERRRNIGGALAGSGLASNAINDLGSESREDSYNALCLLFAMAKTGEVQPLVDAIQEHEDVQVRRAAIRLLNLVGQPEIAKAAAKRRLSIFSE